MVFGIEMVEPIHKPVEDGAIIYNGTITPVEDISFSFKRYEGGKAYDYAIAEVPKGWKKIDSPLYADPLTVTIIPSQFAKGTYLIPIHIYDEKGFDKLPNITVFVKLNIDRDFFTVKAPKTVIGNIKQPLRFSVQVSTKTPTVFVIEAHSLNNDFKKEVFIHGNYSQAIEFIYSVPDRYPINITVYPKYASSIKQTLTIDAIVKESILEDLKSLRYGILIYYPIQLLPNALIGLVYSLINP